MLTNTGELVRTICGASNAAPFSTASTRARRGIARRFISNVTVVRECPWPVTLGGSLPPRHSTTWLGVEASKQTQIRGGEEWGHVQ